MGSRRPNNPVARFNKLIQSSSTIPETKQFRARCLDCYRQGGVMAVVHFVEARQDLGLIVDPHTQKAAHELAFVAGVLVEIALTPPEKPPQRPYAERLHLINERENERRRREERTRHIKPGIGKPLKTAPRMAAAFDRMLMQLIKRVQREAA